MTDGNAETQEPSTGEMVDADVIEIVEIDDPPVRIVLADGTILRLKTDVIEVTRFNDEWDQDGNPLYTVRSGNIVGVLESPEDLRKNAPEGSIQ